MTGGEFLLGGRVRLHHGDSRDVLAALPDASIDSVVTDPPYALVSIGKRFGKDGAAPARAREGGSGVYKRASAGFMGQQWDTGETAFDPDFWSEVLRVLKPGGHLVAFGGTRTYHRLVCAIEDAGFEIRDQLAWIYGSGFPKSHDIAKGIDAKLGVERTVVGRQTLSNDIRGGALLDAAVDGTREAFERDVTVATSPEARHWEGWGTALKPALEPILLARKPLSGTVAETVLAHGTGGLNIAGCRIGDGGDRTSGGPSGKNEMESASLGGGWHNPKFARPTGGRWPANVMHDGSDEVIALFPDTKSGRMKAGTVRTAGNLVYGAGMSPAGRAATDVDTHGDAGSAARFFYSAKADAEDRVGSGHPTIKPLKLMEWLCTLVTPPGGVVLDPFAGSGTTGEAAWRVGLSAVLIEREASFCADIRRRMALATAGPGTRKGASARRKAPEGDHGPLFGGARDGR